MVIWNTLSRRQIYSQVGTNPNGDKLVEQDETRTLADLQGRSSVVVNKFFNATVHSDGRRRWSKNTFMLMILGLCSLASGCFILLCHPYEMIFKWKVSFSEGGETFELWRKPPVDLYVKIYLFNVTNRDEYLKGEESKIRFQEVGPYVYKESFEHADVIFNENGTLSAIPVHPLKYVPEMSNGTEEDLVIMPNIALFSITNVMKDAAYLTRWGLNTLIRQTDTRPLVQMTAREFMFGYQSTLVTLGNHLMPSWIHFDKLGLIDRMYDFDGDSETIYTGETDIRMTGLIDTYNGDVNLSQWTGKCANVQGASDGAKFPSYIQPNDTLLFFRKSLCRSARLVRIGEQVIESLDTYKYTFRENELDNGAVNPENKCFCRQGRCLQAGLIDVTDCYYGFPIALSYPHFYKSDPSLLEAVDGLNPKKELHESYFYIQPKSGLPVKLASRFQINMALQDIGHMARVEKFPGLTIPMLWFEIGMYKLPTVMKTRFWFYLNFMPVAEEAIMYLLFISGIVLFIWSIMRILTGQTKKSSLELLEMKKKKQKMQTNKQIDSKEKETDVYNTLLSSNNPNLTLIV